jgi:hypothetical protein
MTVDRKSKIRMIHQIDHVIRIVAMKG